MPAILRWPVTPLLVILCAFAATAQPKIRDLKSTVILVAIDGFRHDYIERYKPPAISQLASNGVRAKALIPSFPTKTFPNFYSIVTGLYPANHGIVDNSFFDGDGIFRYTNVAEAENPKYWLGEPIWVTAEKQGQRTSTYFYPGSNTRIKDTLPSMTRRFNARVPNEMRVDMTLVQLDAPVDRRPTFLTTYFSEVDEVAHEFGPDSDEVRYAVMNIDRTVGRLVEGLRLRGIDQQVNIMLVSDHGLATVRFTDTVIIDDYLDEPMLSRKSITSRIIWHVFPKAGREKDVMRRLAEMKGATCWERAEIPRVFKYRNSNRIPPIFCVADPGRQFLTREAFESERDSIELRTIRGDHGYDNRHPDMQALFVAYGPAFKRGRIVEPFENVEIYNLFCKVLNLKPAANNGSLERVKHLLK